MVEDIDPHIIGTESWANKDITYAELGLIGYVMFKRDQIGRRTGQDRKYLFVPKTTKQSIQHKNHTIYYIYVDMRKRSGKNIEYGLKIKDNVI